MEIQFYMNFDEIVLWENDYINRTLYITPEPQYCEDEHDNRYVAIDNESVGEEKFYFYKNLIKKYGLELKVFEKVGDVILMNQDVAIMTKKQYNLLVEEFRKEKGRKVASRLKFRNLIRDDFNGNFPIRRKSNNEITDFLDQKLKDCEDWDNGSVWEIYVVSKECFKDINMLYNILCGYVESYDATVRYNKTQIWGPDSEGRPFFEGDDEDDDEGDDEDE